MSTKKANGEGTVYKDKSGVWIAEISWKDKARKMHRKRWKDRKQTEVKQKLKEFKKVLLLSDGDYENRSDVVFREYAEFWMEEINKPKLKPSSYMRKQVTMQYQVLPHIGDIPINMVSSADIRQMIKALQEQGLSYSTIKKAYECTNACFKYYIIQKNPFGFQNPCLGVSLPRNENEAKTPVFFNKGQRELIAAEATRCYSNGTPVYRMGWAFPLLMYTGMRLGELLALTWGDVDFAQKTITINKNSVVVNTSGHYIMTTQTTTKTKHGTRIIPLNAQALNALREIKKVTGGEPYVICTKNHKQVSPRKLNENFHHILERAGIVDANQSYGVHTLRHTFASMLFQNGCEVKVVSELLGHSNTGITENTYIHLLQEQKIRAITNIDDFSE